MPQSKLHAVIPAAGVGARMGATIPKQYLPINGEPMLSRTLQRVLQTQDLDQLVVALGPQDAYWEDEIPADIRNRVQRVDGGQERADSVLAGLKALLHTQNPTDLVLVHDAARPAVLVSDIDTLVATVRKDATNGGLLAIPVRDTMKRSDAEGRVTETVPRALLWHALTPQLFELGLLCDAIERAVAAGVAVTDEASAMEWAGYRPVLVEGDVGNVKVTVRGDLGVGA